MSTDKSKGQLKHQHIEMCECDHGTVYVRPENEWKQCPKCAGRGFIVLPIKERYGYV